MAKAIDTPDESLYRLIATQLITGVSKTEIAKSLNTNVQRVNVLLKNSDFKSVMTEITDDLLGTAVASWKGAMSERIEQSLKVIDFHLKTNNIEAVKIVLKSLGLDNQAPTVAAQGSLTVVLPNYETGKTVKAEVIDATIKT